MLGHFCALSALLLLATTAEAAKILALFTIPAKSHVGAYQIYLEELAKRGHEVTVVTAFPRKTPLANFTEIVLEDTFPARDNKDFNLFEIRESYFIPMMFFFFHTCYDSCAKVLSQPNMQKLIHSKDLHYDLVLYEPFFTECTYGLLHKFKAPRIQVVPNTIIPWAGDPVGNPSTVSYIPELMTEKDTLDFSGRLLNSLRVLFINLFRNFYIVPKMDALMRKHFPDPTLPSIHELEAQTAFLFLHSHPVLNYPRPLTPNTIEVGGLHLRNTPQLPQDLQKYLDDAPHGVIYFSLGSNVRSVDMPEGKRNAILQAFSKLKQKVLWKWEADTMPGQPQNVRLGKWLPQHGILAHPNVKVFITHGGLMSTQEATYFGVPLIAIPIMADQKFNAMRAENSGYAIRVDVHNITEKSLSWALREILHEPGYRERAQQLSRLFRDQPQTPMERALFWTEFALRHQGAAHLRSAALDLSFCEYYLLDVIAVLVLAVFASLLVLVWLGRALFKCLCSKSTSKKSVSKGKKTN